LSHLPASQRVWPPCKQSLNFHRFCYTNFRNNPRWHK
jgi:hypothetical protein